MEKLDAQTEKWKPVIGYEGLYEVSNFGRVKILKNIHKNNESTFAKIESIPNGYLRIGLTKNGNIKRYCVHKLVAIHFIPNPQNKPEVNHEDGNKQNAHYSNLSWVTKSENIKHAIRTGLLPIRTKEVYLFDNSGKLINKFPSIYKCASFLKVSKPSVSLALKRKGTLKGFLLSFTEYPIIPEKTYRHEVIEIDANGLTINKFPSSRQAAISLNLNCPSFLRKVCEGKFKHYKGHFFRYSSTHTTLR